MTSVVTNLAQQYRARAEEARLRSEETTDDDARMSLLQIAETWERMAKWEELNNPQRNRWKDPEPLPETPPKPYV